MTLEAIFLLLVLEHYKAKLLASIVVTESGCWEWQRSGDGRYGHIHILGERFKSHVASALLFRGILLRTRVLRHRCDNSICCCPDHLNPGTQKQNRQEASERGRAANGLTAAAVARLRNLLTRGHSPSEAARRVGCHRSTASRIASGAIR